MTLQLQYGERLCPECDGTGVADYEIPRLCGLCDSTGELGEHSNHSVDLRPYMNAREFNEYLLKLFPPNGAECHPQTAIESKDLRQPASREGIKI